MKKVIAGITGLAIILLALAFRKDIEQGIIGYYYSQKLQKIEPSTCVNGTEDFKETRSCLEKIGYPFSILGDTIKGNFRITFSKPFAEAFVEAKNWKWNGSGVGIRNSFHSNSCFISQEVDIPEFTEGQKQLIKKYIAKWYEANPEAERRYIVNIKEEKTKIKIESLPLEMFKNYTQYCPDGFGMKYLDDRPNFNLDETELELSGT